MVKGKVLDIRLSKKHVAEIEYFSFAQGVVVYTTRKIHFRHRNKHDGAYIIWNGKKKIVESLFL